MRTKVFILTNNPKAKEEYPEAFFVGKEFLDILLYARDLIHLGHRLISHPLTGSVKPKETKYKSILMTAEAQSLDMKSLQLIESAIVTTEKFKEVKRNWPDVKKIDEDFQVIDLTLLQAGVEALNSSTEQLVAFSGS